MLTLTDNARVAIGTMLAEAPGSDSSGLRIAAMDDAPGSVGLSIVETPSEGDTVIDQPGARVFLESSAAAVLDRMVLDARPGDAGAVEFRLGPQ